MPLDPPFKSDDGDHGDTALLVQRIDALVTIHAVSPRIGIDAGGYAVAVWSRSGHLWSNQATAATGWGTAADIDLRSAVGGGYQPQVAVDAVGDAIAVRQRQGTSTPPGPEVWSNLLK